MILIVLLLSIIKIIFSYLWNDKEYIDISLFYYFPLLILLMFVHEVVHAITAYFLSLNRSISNLRIGFSLKKFIAYCSYDYSFNVRETCFIALMPLFCLGIIPFFISIIYGVPLLFSLSMVMIIGSAGDITLFFYIYKLKKTSLLDLRILKKHYVIIVN